MNLIALPRNKHIFTLATIKLKVVVCNPLGQRVNVILQNMIVFTLCNRSIQKHIISIEDHATIKG